MTNRHWDTSRMLRFMALGLLALAGAACGRRIFQTSIGPAPAELHATPELAVAPAPEATSSRSVETEAVRDPTPPKAARLAVTELGGRLPGPPLAALEDAFFDYDRYDLEEAARTNLDLDARILSVHGDTQFLIEGHCDERGSEKYNLALGDRRANEARHYLVAKGVAPDRVSTVSYGE